MLLGSMYVAPQLLAGEQAGVFTHACLPPAGTRIGREYQVAWLDGVHM